MHSDHGAPALQARLQRRFEPGFESTDNELAHLHAVSVAPCTCLFSKRDVVHSALVCSICRPAALLATLQVAPNQKARSSIQRRWQCSPLLSMTEGLTVMPSIKRPRKALLDSLAVSATVLGCSDFILLITLHEARYCGLVLQALRWFARWSHKVHRSDDPSLPNVPTQGCPGEEWASSSCCEIFAISAACSPL